MLKKEKREVEVELVHKRNCQEEGFEIGYQNRCSYVRLSWLATAQPSARTRALLGHVRILLHKNNIRLYALSYYTD